MALNAACAVMLVPREEHSAQTGGDKPQSNESERDGKAADDPATADPMRKPRAYLSAENSADRKHDRAANPVVKKSGSHVRRASRKGGDGEDEQ